MKNLVRMLGTAAARTDYMEKTAENPLPRIKRYLRTLAGRNIGEVFYKHYKQTMSHPYVQRLAAKHPRDMATFESYIAKALKGSERNIPGIWDLPPRIRRLKGARSLLRKLTRGQKAIAAERKATLRARLGLTGAATLLGTGVATGAALRGGSAGTEKVSAASDDESLKDIVPAIGAGVVGTSPLVQGFTSHALHLPESKKLLVKDVETLEKMLKPGDIILTSKPGVPSVFKIPITLLGGDPYGYHVESVFRKPRGGPPQFIHSTPASGGAAVYEGSLRKGEDVIVKRFKDPALAKKYLRNLEKLKRQEDVLEEALGPYARSRMYDIETATKGALKSLLPKPLRNLLKSTTPLPGATVCSTLPALASPECLAPGIPRHEVMPHHIQKSPALKTEIHYRAPREIPMRAFEDLLRTAPWLLRGALGAGLGFAAYKGIKALTND